MSDHQSLIEQQHIPADDGWDDAAGEASERMIRGQTSEVRRLAMDSRQRGDVVDRRNQTDCAGDGRRCGSLGGRQAGRAHRPPSWRTPARAGKAQPHRRARVADRARQRAQRPLAEHSVDLPRRSRHRRGVHLLDLILGRTRRRHRAWRHHSSHAHHPPRRRADRRTARGGDADQTRPQVQAGVQNRRLEERQRRDPPKPPSRSSGSGRLSPAAANVGWS